MVYTEPCSTFNPLSQEGGGGGRGVEGVEKREG